MVMARTMTTAAQPRAYFFGCVGRVGHHLFSPPSSIMQSECLAPWKVGEIDQAMQPGCTRGVGARHDEQLLGVARLHHRAGWTMLSCWDRSVDRRPGSNANFMVEGEHDFEAMLALAAEAFPGVWKRVVTQPGIAIFGTLLPEPTMAPLQARP
jgi:hypothetical protein